MEKERAADIAKIVGKLEKLKDQVEKLRDSEQEIYDDMSEEQQESSKGEALQEVIDNLDTAYSDVDDAISVLEEYTDGISYEEEEEKKEMEKGNMDEVVDLKPELKFQKSKGSEDIGFPKNLRRNTEIMTGTFEANNLQCLNIGCKYEIDKKDHNLYFYVEIATISGKLDRMKTLHINLYDEDGDLCDSDYTAVCTFSGLDTETISFSSKNDNLEKAVKARVYVKD